MSFNEEKGTHDPNISVHAWRNNHSIEFNNARVIDKGNFQTRKTFESWHTAEADKNSKPLPKQYSILLARLPFLQFFHTSIIYYHLAHLHLSFRKLKLTFFKICLNQRTPFYIEYVSKTWSSWKMSLLKNPIEPPLEPKT